MKKLFTVLLLLLSVADAQSQCFDIYFRRMFPTFQYEVETEWTDQWCAAQSWNAPSGMHKLLEIPSQCAILSLNPLYITPNSAYNYGPDSCDNPPFQMKMQGYIQFHAWKWVNGAWVYVGSNSKNSFQLQSTGKYPYAADSSHMVTQQEWDYITQYATPPLALATMLPAPSSNAYVQQIGAGYIDTYAAGYYNNGLIIDGWLPGIYKIICGVYPAEYICEQGPFPNTQEYILEFDGDETFIETTLPACQYSDVNSPTGCFATQAWGHGGDGAVSISFNEVPGIDSVSFQRWKIINNFSGQNSGQVVKKAVSELFYDATLHRYIYTFTPEFPRGKYRWYIKAHNCYGWSTESVTESDNSPYLNVH